MAGEINDRTDSQINKWSQSAPEFKQEEGNSRSINIQDTFKETDKDNDKLTIDILKSAGTGAALGIGFANKSELTKLKKQIENLEKKSAPHKSLHQKLLDCLRPDAPTDSAISKSTKEILKESHKYDQETKESMFENHFKEIMNSAEASPGERIIAKFALKERENLKYTFGTYHKKWYQQYLLSSDEETMEYLTNPKNTEDSAGKSIMNLYKKINQAAKHEERQGKYTAYLKPASALNAAFDSIIQSEESTYYEKSIANFWTKMLSGLVCHDRDTFIKDDHIVIKGILEASEDSNPAKDIVDATPKEYKSAVSDHIFKIIATSPDSGKDDKDLAKQALEIEDDFSKSTKEQFKDKYKILKQLRTNQAIDLTQGMEKLVSR